jgi:hypothetical protein
MRKVSSPKQAWPPIQKFWFNHPQRKIVPADSELYHSQSETLEGRPATSESTGFGKMNL